MTAIVKTYVAYGTRGQRTEGYLALTWQDAVDGFKNQYGRDADIVSEGTAFLDRSTGDLRMEPALTESYSKPIRGNRAALWDACVAANTAMQQPALKSATGGVDVFYDAMDNELMEDDA